MCDETITQLNTASTRLRHINQLLVTLTTTQSISHQLQSLATVNKNNSLTQDAYIPSFYVPSNPPIAKQCLDYAAMDNENALTSEGKLKARLLHLINKRQEVPDSLPIVAAVGMSGTGKTCALRGLNAENDLRQLFQDGILFLFCGPSASQDHIKQGLCSMVSRTGGNALSREMNAIEGAYAIDVIIEKVSAWFKHKKCLFLVDDIWNTTATRLALLSKLSTVVENCHTTSGLVYTTRDARIDTFDTSVRFEWLDPQSPVCWNLLATAAGFTLEQIEQADQLEALFYTVIHCNGLKMALIIAGRQVRMRAARYGEHKAKAWDSYANVLKDRPRQLLTQENGEYGSLFSQFSVSLETLSSQESDKLSFHMPYGIEQVFESLCVVDKGQVLHDSMLCRLWGLESIQQAREVSKLFADLSLVETTFELIDGDCKEGILVHDLVHDYADSLADQRYRDRDWIKGWEVWGLRLLERTFGAGESAVSSSQGFEEWWRKEDVNRHFHRFKDEDRLQSIMARISYYSRLQSGQTLLKHSVGIDRFFNVSTPEPTTLVDVCFTLRKSTVIEMHEFASTMAHEREVALSNLTSRVLIFAVLLHLRLVRLAGSHHAAAEMAQGDESRLILRTGEERYRCLRHCDSGSPPELQKTSFDNDLVTHFYVIPRNFGKYLQNSIALNWTLYDNCVEAPEIDVEEHYRLLGAPLTLSNMKEAGIECDVVFFSHQSGSENFRPLSLREVCPELGDSAVRALEPSKDDYCVIPASVFASVNDAEGSCLVDHSCSRYLHLHEMDPKDRHVLKQYTVGKIIELWSGGTCRLLREAESELHEEGQ